MHELELVDKSATGRVRLWKQHKISNKDNRSTNVTAVAEGSKSPLNGGHRQTPGIYLDPSKSYQRIYKESKERREPLEQFESRNELYRILKKIGVDREGLSDNGWDYVYKFKETASELFFNSSEDDEYRAYRYRSCHWLKRKAAVIVHEGGISYQDNYRCHEKFCLRCEKKRRGKITIELIERIQALAYSNPDFPGVLQLVFTLPENIEDKPLHDKDLEKNILAAIHGYIREVFGVGTRANIACQLSVHPVGGSDLYRDRWHVHADVVPVTTTKGVATWHYPKLTRTESVHTNPWRKIDYLALRDLWREKLVSLFGAEAIPERLPNVQTTFLDYRDKEFNPDSKYWLKLRHAVKYNQRSFVEDLESGVLLTDVSGGRVIRKAASGWRLLSIEDDVERFMWVRDHALTRARGILTCLKKHADALNLTYECKTLILPWVAPLGESPVVTGIYPATITECKDKEVEKYMQPGVGGLKDRKRVRVLRKTVTYIEYTDDNGIIHSGKIEDLCDGPWKWPRLLLPF